MKKTILLFLTMCSLYIVSCSDDEQNIQPEPQSVFSGTWEGTFSGDDNGVWSATINNKGEVSGTVRSNDNNLTFEMVGSVNQLGILDASYTSTQGITIRGNFDGTLTSDTGQGIWNAQNNTLNGTWEGTKKQ